MAYSETKITITLELNDLGTAEDMAAALVILQRIGVTPLGKVQLTFPVMQTEAAEILMDNLDVVLGNVPGGVVVTMKAATERGVDRHEVANRPMDKYFNN